MPTTPPEMLDEMPTLTVQRMKEIVGTPPCFDRSKPFHDWPRQIAEWIAWSERSRMLAQFQNQQHNIDNEARRR